MQILLLGLFVAIFLHDSTAIVDVVAVDGSTRVAEALPGDVWPRLGPAAVLAVVLGPKLLLAGLYQLQCVRTRGRLGEANGHKSMRLLEAWTTALPLILLSLFVVDLMAGGLRLVRLARLRHVVLVDELAIMLPTLIVAVLSWWSYYPVDRRLRESITFRLADAGKPVYPLLTRGEYVTMQCRHQLGLLLPPLLVVFAWSEALTLLGPDHRGVLTAGKVALLTPLGVLTVFLLTPVMIRHVWHTAPLAAGEVRDRMLALCVAHRVAIRELLLWRTGGGLVNAAVTGLIGRVRYILLSDGLLDQVDPRGVEAVMAHEIAHVKLRHILWMIAAMLATLGVLEYAAYTAYDRLVLAGIDRAAETDGGMLIQLLTDPTTQTLLIAGPVFLLTLWVFGWVSRRIERQADVFAARHLAQTAEPHHYDDAGRLVFDRDSVMTMVHALRRVAELNHAPVTRKSWRHGSIAWRQDHLRSLIGTPVHDTPVDRVLARVKLATLAGLAVVVLTSYAGGIDVAGLLAW